MQKIKENLWRDSNWKEGDLKIYKQIIRKKKIDFMVSRREELIFLGKNNPKLFWKELQVSKKQIENNITTDQWLEYARQLYEQNPKVEPPPPLVKTATITKLFTVQEIEVGIKKLGVGKAKDLVELQAEYLKWGSKTLAPHITGIFNNIIQ